MASREGLTLKGLLHPRRPGEHGATMCTLQVQEKYSENDAAEADSPAGPRVEAGTRFESRNASSREGCSRIGGDRRYGGRSRSRNSNGKKSTGKNMGSRRSSRSNSRVRINRKSRSKRRNGSGMERQATEGHDGGSNSKNRPSVEAGICAVRSQVYLVCQRQGQKIDYTRAGFETRSSPPPVLACHPKDVVYLKRTKHTAGPQSHNEANASSRTKPRMIPTDLHRSGSSPHAAGRRQGDLDGRCSPAVDRGGTGLGPHQSVA